MKAFLRPHRFRHLYPVRFYTTKTQSGHRICVPPPPQAADECIGCHRTKEHAHLTTLLCLTIVQGQLFGVAVS